MMTVKKTRDVTRVLPTISAHYVLLTTSGPAGPPTVSALPTHFSSVSEFPHNAKNLSAEKYVQVGNLQDIARASASIEASITESVLQNYRNDDIDEVLEEAVSNAQIVQDRAKAVLDSHATQWEYGEGAEEIFRFQQNHDKNRTLLFSSRCIAE